MENNVCSVFAVFEAALGVFVQSYAKLDAQKELTTYYIVNGLAVEKLCLFKSGFGSGDAIHFLVLIQILGNTKCLCVTVK